MIKTRLLSAALLVGLLAPTASFADQRSYNVHIRMFDRKEQRLQDREAFIQNKQNNGQGDAADNDRRLANLRAHEDRLQAKEDAYRAKHPSR